MSAAHAPLILIGAGSHAKVLVDSLQACECRPDAYVDDENKPWLDSLGVPRMSEESLQSSLEGAQLVIGFVGLSCASLLRRLEIMALYEAQGATFPSIIHPSAIVSPQAKIGPGVQILPGAIINSHAVIEKGAVINSGAIVEHDAHVGTGVHIAPGAVVLGGAKIGECSYIGSGAVVVQNTTVINAEFVKALTVKT